MFHNFKWNPNPTRTILTLGHDFKISVDVTFTKENTKRAGKKAVVYKVSCHRVVCNAYGVVLQKKQNGQTMSELVTSYSH